jgi:type IV pilus assembly protein PilF
MGGEGMTRMGRTLIGAVVAVLVTLAGCVSTEVNPVEKSDTDAARYNTQLGATYLQRGELELARDKLEKAVRQDPDLASARGYLGVLYERIDEPEKAGREYRAAVRLAPDSPDILNTYGGYLCRNGQREEGIEYFLKAARNPLYRTPQAALTNAGVCARGIPDQAAAEEYFRQALARVPGYREALIQLAALNYVTRDYLQAQAFLERFLQYGDATPDALILGVRIEDAQGNSRAAAEYRERLRTEFPAAARAFDTSATSRDDG